MKVNDRLSKLSAGEVPQFGQICKVIQAYVSRIFEALAKCLSTTSLDIFVIIFSMELVMLKKTLFGWWPSALWRDKLICFEHLFGDKHFFDNIGMTVWHPLPLVGNIEQYQSWHSRWTVANGHFCWVVGTVDPLLADIEFDDGMQIA